MTKLEIYASNFRKNPRFVISAAISRIYNATLGRFVGLLIRKPSTRTNSIELTEIIQHSQRKRTDITDHLVTLFTESLAMRPELIVELGVRGGESTFVFERVAGICRAKLISVDLENCAHVSNYEYWIFQQQDDIAFAKDFKSWCEVRNIHPCIDVLFIDTSHLYEHTVQEIEHWFVHLKDRAKVIFHDTNMQTLYFRKDGSTGVNMDEHRGVIAALEHYFQRHFNERRDFIDLHNGWLIKHHSGCSGLTILERIQKSS